ncbi:MAG: hypothetical protein EOO73_11830 [Myxococcales bacterium]|nr:MAG: hypothetical protein EOO73_11830 [Myxococcales bacterium]
MRWELGLALLACGCDLVVIGSAPVRQEVPDSPVGEGGMKSGAAGGTTFPPPPPLTVDTPAVAEPEPELDWCTVAAQQGATFCEASETTLEYCEPAPVAPLTEGAGGAEAGLGADRGGAGAGLGGAGEDAGAAGASASASASANAGTDAGGARGDAGAAGASGAANACPQYEHPPFWVYDLVVQCAAHCGVAIRSSERRLGGTCCYTAYSVYGGR